MPSLPAENDALLGRTLGHYRLLEKIGAGGMGDVYRAYDEHLDREVALKVLPQGFLAVQTSRKRFRREALALSRAGHSNIATVYDFDTQQGVDFLAMEYIPGISLSTKIANRPLTEKEAINLGIQLAEGLSAAHEHGVIHRDVKPGNLRLTVDGRLKILDFGIAKLHLPTTANDATETLTGSEAMTGTLPYMAPEQVFGGEIDVRTDIYGAGSVLYEMVTGRRPFPDVERDRLTTAILHRPPQSPSTLNQGISLEIQRIILKCLEKEPKNRYQSAKELAVDLRRLQAGEVSGVQQAPRIAWLLSGKFIGSGVGILLLVASLLVALNFGGRLQRMLGQTGPQPVESLAVLPLVNLSNDPQQEYFADGMMEELITTLGHIKALRVISRTSAMQYKHTNKALPAMARELNVDAFVEGSVLRFGKRVRITAQLIQAKPERQLWAGSYERDIGDILALQDDVASAIAGEIQVKLAPNEHSRLSNTRSVDPAAYEAYLQGRYRWNERSRKGVLQSLEYYQQAIRADPSYALAYAGIADSYIVMVADHWISPGEGIPPARTAALKALSIDDTLAEAHTSMSSIAESDWDWVTAEKEYRRALELNPNYATAHHWYSGFLSEIGRDEEAAIEARRAVELDPLSPAINTNLGEVLYMGRHYDDSQSVLLKVIEKEPRFWPAYYSAAKVFMHAGRFNEAIAALQQAAVLSPEDDSILSALVYAYGRSGRIAEGKKTLVKWENLTRGRYVSDYLLAESYLGLGQKEKAMQLLTEAFQQHDALLVSIASESMLDPLRSDSRFQDLLRHMNLVQRVSG
jgi:serine/threonine protein kinase/tetratricopeptide (TPR) repeat protein